MTPEEQVIELQKRVDALEKQVEALTKFALNLYDIGYQCDGGIKHHEKGLISCGIGLDQFYKSNDIRMHDTAITNDVTLEIYMANIDRKYSKYAVNKATMRYGSLKDKERIKQNNETEHEA